MVADDLADYLFARSTGHFASLMTLITRGCRRAVRTGTEKLTRDLLDQVRNDAAAEAARQELLAAFDAGKLSARPRRRRDRAGTLAAARLGRSWRPSRSACPRCPARRSTAGWKPTPTCCTSPSATSSPSPGWTGTGSTATSAPASRGSTSWTSPTWPRSAPSPGSPPQTLAGMTLARYQGTGLAEVTAAPGMRRTPRWWRQLSGSRYCPRCLAANGGRWMLAWRIPWAFACTGCQVLLADTCPDCGRRHRRTRTGQPRQPGRCDLTGLPLPPWRPPRGGTAACTSDPAGTPRPSRCPPAGTCWPPSSTSTPSSPRCSLSRGQPAETAVLQQYLDDIHAVARAAVSALNGHSRSPGRCQRGPGRTRRASQDQALPRAPLASRLGPGRAGSSRPSPRSASPSPTSCCTAGRGDPDPVIAAWLAGNTASRRNTTSPADVLAHWDQASPALQAALARPLAARLDTFCQLRYRAVAGPARIPDPARAQERAAALPSLMWPGWALRLMPPGGLRLPAATGSRSR